MMLRSRVMTRTLSAAAALAAAFLTCVAHGASDELSLVQMSASRGGVQETDEEEEAEEDFERTFHRGHAVASLLAVHGIPGVKGIKEQLQEAAAFKMPPPEKGYHEKVAKALPKLEAECKSKPYTTEADCDRAVDMLTMMNKATEGPEPAWTWHLFLRNMLGLHFWLYTPGTMLCFSILDADQSKGISHEEMEKLFGPAMMAATKGIWRFLDQDADGNITREELYKYLRAAILVREYLPELDPLDPTADSRKCLNMAHRVLAPPAAPVMRLKFYPKLLSIAGIFIGAIALHCLLCAKTSKKAINSKPDIPVGKEILSK